MPAVSCYLSQNVLTRIKAKAKAINMPVSRMISEAVEYYLGASEQREARERVLKVLLEEKPLGGKRAWAEVHQERTFIYKRSSF